MEGKVKTKTNLNQDAPIKIKTGHYCLSQFAQSFRQMFSYRSSNRLEQACPTRGPGRLWMRPNKKIIYLQTKSGQMTTFLSRQKLRQNSLICREFVPVFKDYNLKRHYTQKHAAKFSAYQGMCRKDKITELKKSVSRNVS
jgi:hypothetical protein